MSYRHLDWVFGDPKEAAAARPMHGLTHGARLLALYLAWHANKHSGKCNPSIETLCVELDASDKSVRRWMRELIDRGIVRRREAFSDIDGRQLASQYDFLAVQVTAQPGVFADGGGASDGEGEGGHPVQPGGGHLGEGAPPQELHPNKEDNREVEQDSESEAIPFAELERIWNQLCGSRFGRIVKLSPKRKKHLAARFRGEFKGHVEQWRVYCERIAQSSFLCGGNDRGWKPDFDWVINPNNCVKILEGKYDDRRRAAPAANLPTEREQEVLAWIRSDGLLMPTDGDPPTEAEIAAARAKWPERCTRDWTRRHATVAA